MSLLATLILQSAKMVRLEDLDISHVTQQWGDPHQDQSVEGHSLKIGGQGFTHGLGTHTNGSVVIRLNGGAERFEASVGVDDDTYGKGSIQFEIWVDGKRIAQTPVMKGGQPPVKISADLKGANKVVLISSDAGDGNSYDHADWCDAKLTLAPKGRLPIIYAPPSEPTMPISMKVSVAPEIHGARVLGCSPGKPVFFKIPATGQGRLLYRARHLPAGLYLDSLSGVIAGRITKPGVYPIDLYVRSSRGAAKRSIQISCKGGVALTPPMGWNSWNVWGTSVTAAKVKAAADSMIKAGLFNYGYRFVNIDDAWEGSRNADGEIQTNAKFGDMKALSDYVHAKGLGLGIYSSPGPKTCAGFEGSYHHEEQDAKTYAKWGIDYLKYDWCSYGELFPKPTLEELKSPYVKMSAALKSTPRDIIFSLCQYGMGDVHKWGGEVGGNLWRTTGDISDSYQSMSDIAFDHSPKSTFVKPGGWNDPDMLVVGKLGWGDHPRPTHLSGNEQITHLTMWSLWAAPLILGCDLTKLDDWTKALITNHDVIEVDQDPEGHAATRVFKKDSGEVWCRKLWDGTLAVGLLNRGTTHQRVSVSWAALGLHGRKPVRDLWLRRDLGRKRRLSFEVPAHGAKLFRIGRISEL